jgi:hypothetical protein
MKKLVLVALSLLMVVLVAGAGLADNGGGKFTGKAGDSIYVCGCGAGCKCGSMANKEAKCGCGKDMVKATVSKVEKGKVYYKVEGEELSAPAQGKYACGCGEGCKCGAISQKPGKCACGKELIEVK